MIKNFIKRAYATQMTYEVSNAEKIEAERALLYFNNASKLLDKASNHLDLINTPFKDNQAIAMDDIFKARAALIPFITACLLITGSCPGKPMQIGQTLVLASLPK